MGIEAVFPNALPDQANTVAILIGLKHLTTQPLICDAHVEWGAGSHPDIDLYLIEEPIPYSVEELDNLAAQFPKLLSVFENAIMTFERGGAA